MSERVAILGAGKMGEALLAGLLRAGRPADDLRIVERRDERVAELVRRYGIAAVTNTEAATSADTLVLAVKPQDLGSVLDELRPVLSPTGAEPVRPDRGGRLVVSLAAGIPVRFLERRLNPGVAVVRVMSNTPALVGEAMSALSAGSHAGEEQLRRAEELLGAVGAVVRVPESQLDAVTALSGSGPAYFFYLVEAMTEAGVLLGLPRQLAHDLVVQTAVGAAVMLRDSGEHPVALREAVTSPGGTTISAIRELEIHRVRAALLAAVEAARDRSRELAEGVE